MTSAGFLPMLYNDFIAHLARRGVLRYPQMANGGLNARQGDGLGNLDWVGLTKLTASAFADEFAAFCSCSRVQRGDLVDSQFAGAQLSARFLRERTSVSLPGFVRKSDACDCTPDRWRNG